MEQRTIDDELLDTIPALEEWAKKHATRYTFRTDETAEAAESILQIIDLDLIGFVNER